MADSRYHVKIARLRVAALTAICLACILAWTLGADTSAKASIARFEQEIEEAVESLHRVGRVAAAVELEGADGLSGIVEALRMPRALLRVEWLTEPPGTPAGRAASSWTDRSAKAPLNISYVSAGSSVETWMTVPLPNGGYLGSPLALGEVTAAIAGSAGGHEISVVDITAGEKLPLYPAAGPRETDSRPIADAERLSFGSAEWLVEARLPAATSIMLPWRLASALLCGLAAIFAAARMLTLSRSSGGTSRPSQALVDRARALEQQLSECAGDLEHARRTLLQDALILDCVPAMIWVKDRHNRIVRANRTATDSLGIPPGSLDGKSTFDLYPAHAQKYFDDDLEVIGSNRPKLGIVERYDSSRGTLWVRTDKVPYSGVDGQCAGVVVCSVDITEHKMTEDRLSKLTRQLERSNKELEQFAFVSSHDLQEPLRTIHNYARLLENRCPEGDMSSKRMLKSIVDASGRAYDLITDILRYARMNAAERPVSAVSSERILKQALVGLSGTIREKSAVIRYQNLPSVVVNDTYAQQLFQNLIANALKFNNRPAPAIHIRAERRDEKWLFSIEDNGPGIPEAECERIFEIFQRGSSAAPSGIGLGLALCKKIVEFHGGAIWVDSKPGQGACFNFTLPAACEESTEQAA